MCTKLNKILFNVSQLNQDSQTLIKHVFVSIMLFWKASSPNRPPPPLHPSTLYPLQCFLPVNLYPLLSWISLHTCVNKDSVSMCLCVGPCVVWRGDVSPTYVRILEDPNLLGINQNTCSESTLCQWLTLCPNGFLAAGLFVSPLESSVLFEINLTTVPETDLSMQMLHGEKSRKQNAEKEDKGGQEKRSWMLCITLALKSNKSSSGVPAGGCKQKTKQKKSWIWLYTIKMTLPCSLLKDKACKRTMFEGKKE